MKLLNKSVDFEIKKITESDEFFKFEGLASTFGNEDFDGDIIMPGAFSETLKDRTPMVLWQHDTRQPIGMPETIKETENGLEMLAKLPKDDTFVSGRVIPQMKVGSIRSMSIGFSIDGKDGSTMASDGTRFIRRVKLYEVSLVSFPANPAAQVSGFKATKATADYIAGLKTVRELEAFLLESECFTKTAAKALISRISDLRRDAEPDSVTRWDAGLIEEINHLKEMAGN